MKANLVISGSVQGVGYRAHVRRAAHQHHVKGFVRNLPDGRVEVFAVYGKPETLQNFLADLNRQSTSFIGPHVEKIEIHHEGKPGFKDHPDAIIDDFQIRF